MKKIIGIICLTFVPFVSLATQECSQVYIEEVKHGKTLQSMIKVSDTSCGVSNGFICLDSEAQTMSQSVSNRLYTQVFWHFTNKVPISVFISEQVTGCGGAFPMIEHAVSRSVVF